MPKATVTSLTKDFSKNLELWHDESNTGWVTFEGGRNVKIQSAEMRRLVMRYKPDGANSTRTGIIQNLEAIAIENGPCYTTYSRVSDNYFDLGDAFVDLNTLEIKPAVREKFIRNENMGILPKPDYNGSLNDLTELLPNLLPESKVLLQGAMISAMRPHSPHFIFVLGGPAGSAKTTTQRMVISCIDPRTGDWDSQSAYLASKDPRDLDAMAKTRWVLSLDNFWTLSETLSNKLAVLATGGEVVGREYYTNDDLHTTSIIRPVFINGIGEIVTRADLLSRSIIVNCEMIEQADLEIVTHAFYERLPRILGGILKHVQHAKRYPIKAIYGGRMVSAVSWILSSGVQGFEEAYIDMLHNIDFEAVKLSAVGSAIKDLYNKWTAKEFSNGASARQSALRDTLGLIIPETCYVTTWKNIFDTYQSEPGWPKNEIGFSTARKQVRQNLINIGIDWSEHRTSGGLLDYVVIGTVADARSVRRK